MFKSSSVRSVVLLWINLISGSSWWINSSATTNELKISCLYEYSVISFSPFAVTCSGSDYLSALRSGSGLHSSRPQRAKCASLKQICATYLQYKYAQLQWYTWPSVDVDHQKLVSYTVVWPSRLTAAEVNLVNHMTNRSAAHQGLSLSDLIWPAACSVTDRSEFNQCLL